MAVSGVTETSNVMTMLMNSYIEECEDIVKYMGIHDMLKEQYPQSGYCSTIKKIIKDEYQHQQALFEILNDAGAFFPEKIREAMKKAEDAYGNL